jgi:Mg2+-importing ATPase
MRSSAPHWIQAARLWPRRALDAGVVDRPAVVPDGSSPFWSLPLPDLLASMHSSPDGLAAADAERRLTQHGPISSGANATLRIIRLLLRQFGSPIVLLLIGSAFLSVLLHDATDGAIILTIVVASGVLGFWQEYNAANIVATLLSTVELEARGHGRAGRPRDTDSGHGRRAR